MHIDLDGDTAYVYILVGEYADAFSQQKLDPPAGINMKSCVLARPTILLTHEDLMCKTLDTWKQE